jgi:hypothetical protein
MPNEFKTKTMTPAHTFQSDTVIQTIFAEHSDIFVDLPDIFVDHSGNFIDHSDILPNIRTFLSNFRTEILSAFKSVRIVATSSGTEANPLHRQHHNEQNRSPKM